MNAPTEQNSTSSAQTSHTPEVISVPSDTECVSCDGGHGALGHPMVYYRFDGKDKVTCGYCGRVFIKEK
jgi:uncharacterized Zn-finger protein